MNKYLKLSALFFVITFSGISRELYAKDPCQKYTDRLAKIQTYQRSGHSFKRSNSLNEQARLVSEKLWQCKRSPQRSHKKKKVKNKRVSIKHIPTKRTLTKPMRIWSVKGSNSPFNTSHAIVVKEKFKGDKKYAWLAYYQQPAQCKRPKSLPIFASCSENRQQQQQIFEKSYRE